MFANERQVDIYRRGVVAIDLDGTLLPDTTVSSLLGLRFGGAAEIRELERSYNAGEIGNDVFAAQSARGLRGVRLRDVAEVLSTACCSTASDRQSNPSTSLDWR